MFDVSQQQPSHPGPSGQVQSSSQDAERDRAFREFQNRVRASTSAAQMALWRRQQDLRAAERQRGLS